MMRRKKWLAIACFVTALASAPILRWAAIPRVIPSSTEPRASHVRTHIFADGIPLAIHAIPTGRVAIKSCHQRACLPDATPSIVRMLPIVFGTQFERPMPIWTYVVEHPEGRFAVDTGELVRFQNDPSYGACDVQADWVFHEILSIDIQASEEQATQLATLGLSPTSFAGVVITHQHPDHVGGVGAFAKVPVYVSRTDTALAGRAGGATCRSLAGADLHFDEDLFRPGIDADADAAFGSSYPLTLDRRVLIVPTPGHTPGAASLLVKGDDLDVLFIGDVSFSNDALDGHENAGIHSSMSEARRSQSAVRAYAARRPTLVLPAHDPTVPERMQHRTPYAAHSK